MVKLRQSAQAEVCGAKSRNAEATRKSILCAAYNHFMKEGYDNAGLRSIAAEAGIDPALISRYFGSKKQLFAEVLQCLSDDPMEIVVGEKASCGQRIAETLFSSDEKSQKRLSFIELVTRSITSTEASRLVHQHIETQFILPFCKWLGGRRSKEKAWIMTSILMGWLMLDRTRPKNAVSRKRLAKVLQDVIDQD